MTFFLIFAPNIDSEPSCELPYETVLTSTQNPCSWAKIGKKKEYIPL